MATPSVCVRMRRQPAAHALANDQLGGLELPCDVGIRALLDDPRMHRGALLLGQCVEQPGRPARLTDERLDPLQVILAVGDRVDDPDPAPSASVHTATAQAVGQDVMRDREQPRRGRVLLRPVATT